MLQGLTGGLVQVGNPQYLCEGQQQWTCLTEVTTDSGS